MNTEQELRPCPFCGGTNILVLPRTCDQNTPYDPNDRAMPAVRCMTCYGEAVGKDWTGPETAIAAWNRRSPAVAGGVAEALNAAREWINAADHDEHCFTNDPNPDACRCVCDKDSVIALIDDVTASLAVGDEGIRETLNRDERELLNAIADDAHGDLRINPWDQSLMSLVGKGLLSIIEDGDYNKRARLTTKGRAALKDTTHAE